MRTTSGRSPQSLSKPRPRRGSASAGTSRRLLVVGAMTVGILIPTLASQQTASADSCSLPLTGDITMTDLPGGSNVTSCSAVGRTIVRGDIGITVPDVGHSASATLVYTEESGLPAKEWEISVDGAGIVSYWTESDESSDPTPAAGTPACSDAAYTTPQQLWSGVDYNWQINNADKPVNFTVTQVDGWLETNSYNMTNSYNDCGLTNETSDSMHSSYHGTTTALTGIYIEAGVNKCYDVDRSWGVTGFGYLVDPAAFMTCTFGVGHLLTKAETMINTHYNNWTNSPSAPGCSAKLDIQSAAMKIAGKSFGMRFIKGAAHSNLTFWNYLPSCSGIERTLGKGDVYALRSVY